MGDAEAKGLRERWKKEKDLWQHSTFHIGGPRAGEVHDHGDRPRLPPHRINWRRLRHPETNSSE